METDLSIQLEKERNDNKIAIHLLILAERLIIENGRGWGLLNEPIRSEANYKLANQINEFLNKP